MEEKKPLFEIVATVRLDDGSYVTALASSRTWSTAEAVAFVLGVNPAGIGTTRLAEMFFERGHQLSLAQAREASEKPDLRVDGNQSNVFFSVWNEGTFINVGRVEVHDRGSNCGCVTSGISFRCSFARGHRLLVRNYFGAS